MLISANREIRRKLNANRFAWHERVIRDSKLTGIAIRLAGLVMHAYQVDWGHAQVSLRKAARELGVTQQSIIRARKQLVHRGWLYYDSFPSVAGRPNRTSKFHLGEGPKSLTWKIKLQCDVLNENHLPNVESEDA